MKDGTSSLVCCICYNAFEFEQIYLNIVDKRLILVDFLKFGTSTLHTVASFHNAKFLITLHHWQYLWLDCVYSLVLKFVPKFCGTEKPKSYRSNDSCI